MSHIVNSQDKKYNIDSLLNKVYISYISGNIKQGLAEAKFVYMLSQKRNSTFNQLISLNYITRFYFLNRDFRNAHLFAEKGLKVSGNYKIDSLTGDFRYLNGYIYHIEANYNAAIKNYQQAIIYYNKNQLDKKLGKTYLSIGICENKMSNFELANLYYFKSINEFIKIKDVTDLSDTYNSVASCFLSLNNFKGALKYYQKTLMVRLKLKNTTLIAQLYNNLGFAFKQNSQPDSAIFYLTRCVAMYQKEKDSSLLILPLQNLGSSWEKKGSFRKAESFIIRSLRIAEGYDMSEELARGNLNLGELYLAEKNYKEALASEKITETTAKRLKLPELLMRSYVVESDLYEQQRDYKNALIYEKKANIIKDSIFTYAKNKAINEIEIKYQTAQKEKNIAALNLQHQLESKVVERQKLSIVVLIIAAILLLLFFAIAYNNFRIKNKASRRIQTLMQDLHHRVKNNLQVLSGLFVMQIESLDDETAKNALRENETRLASMNLVHNQLYLDHSTTQIEMQEYLTKLLTHIKDSFGGNVNINIHVDVSYMMIDADKAVAIGLIVNELATNAFKYAFGNAGGEIFLGLKQDGKNRLLLTLADNGRGLKIAETDKTPSFGLKLVNLMARQLNSTLITENENGLSYQMEINL